MKEVFPGVWKGKKTFYTRNLVPGLRCFSEKIINKGGKEYRVWDPYHSKAGAGLAKGLKHFPLKPGLSVLYLGIANGNTASFFSDIIGREGIIYGVEISERSIRDLNTIAQKRGNIVPVLGNAKLPEEYSGIVEKVDFVFQDVATSDQSEILIRNCKSFLKKNGYAMIAIKSRSIDVTKDPDEIYKQEIKKLNKEFKVLEKIRLDPFEKDHMLIVLEY